MKTCVMIYIQLYTAVMHIILRGQLPFLNSSAGIQARIILCIYHNNQMKLFTKDQLRLEYKWGKIHVLFYIHDHNQNTFSV